MDIRDISSPSRRARPVRRMDWRERSAYLAGDVGISSLYSARAVEYGCGGIQLAALVFADAGGGAGVSNWEEVSARDFFHKTFGAVFGRKPGGEIFTSQNLVPHEIQPLLSDTTERWDE